MRISDSSSDVCSSDLVLALSQARALVSVKGFKDIDYAEELAQIEAPALEWRIMLDEPAPEGWLRFDDISSGHLAILDDVAPDPRDAVNIQFTSGTTGRPTGVPPPPHNIPHNDAAGASRAGLRAGARLCL